jgi:hypothetical protein
MSVSRRIAWPAISGESINIYLCISRKIGARLLPPSCARRRRVRRTGRKIKRLGTAAPSNGSLRAHSALPMPLQAVCGGEASLLYSYGVVRGLAPTRHQHARKRRNLLERADRSVMEPASARRGQPRDRTNIFSCLLRGCVWCARRPPEAGPDPSFPAGSARSVHSVALLLVRRHVRAAMPTTRIARWPGNNNSKGIDRGGARRTTTALPFAVLRVAPRTSAYLRDSMPFGACQQEWASTGAPHHLPSRGKCVQRRLTARRAGSIVIGPELSLLLP